MGSLSKGVEKKKSRIGVNIRIYEEKPSGIQNFIRFLFTELIKTYPEHQFIFFSTGKKKIEQTAIYITSNSIIISLLKKINPLLINIFFDNLYILKLICRQKLDIFIGSSYIVPLIKPKNVKYIAVIYDLSYLNYKHNPFNLYLNLVMYMKLFIPFILKRADSIVVPSLYVKQMIKKKYNTNDNKIVIIYGGRDEYFYKIKDEKKFETLRKRYNISREYCFTNTTNIERKNIYGLIDAFVKIDKYTQYQLIITGLLLEDKIKELKDYINRFGVDKKIKFLGFVPKEDLRILYSNAKIFIFPSFEEGFGFPVLEAVSCGCLSICSNTGSLPEIIGNKKLLFNPRDINSIVQKINEVLLLNQFNYNTELAIIQKHIKKFTWKKAVKEYNYLFQKMMNKNI